MPSLSFSFPADLFGLLGILTTIIIYQMRTNDHQLFWKLTTDTFWIIYYFLHGNYSVVAITLVAIFRTVVLMNHEKKWAQGKHWMLIFMGISIAFSLVAWKDWTTLLTMVSSLLCIGMYWYRNPKMVRWISVPAAILFLINVFIHRDWLGVLSESFLLISSIVGIIRLDILEPRKKNKE